MIDYIAVTKHLQGKDKPFLGHCQIEAAYNSGYQKYVLSGCRDLEIYWNEQLGILKLQGSIAYYMQGHNFSYSDTMFTEAISYIESLLKCSLWDSDINEFEYGIIFEVEKSPQEYITHHHTKDKKLTMNEKGKDKGCFRWWEDKEVILKMYDENKNINKKQDLKGKSILKQAGWKPECNYLKWEAHYKKPHQTFNKGRSLILANLINPEFQNLFKQDLMYQYTRLQPMKNLIAPSDKKCLTTPDIILWDYAEILINQHCSLSDMKQRIYAKINTIQNLSSNDKKARKRQIRSLISKLKEASESDWDLSSLITKKLGNIDSDISP